MSRSSFLIELAGPAGSGKSTVAKALSKSDVNIEVLAYPNVRHIRNLPFLLCNALWLVPVFVAFHARRYDRPLTRRQQAIMVILRGWHRQLRKREDSCGAVILLDQGPVYMLSDLLRFGPRKLRQVAPDWWDTTCREWANILDLVICLDAPDAVLLERVRGREKDHGFKRDTDMQAIGFLERCRQTQDATLASMHAACSKPMVARFDTSQASLNDILDGALSLIRQCREG